MATINPYQSYWGDISQKQYPGSSGLWGDVGNNSYLQGTSRYGMGYAGDRAKNSIAASYGLTPQSIGTSPDSWGTSDSLSRPTIAANGIAYQGGSNSKFTGTDPVTKKVYRDGVELTLIPGSSTDYINPNNPSERYAPVSIAKNPALNTVTDAQTAQLAKSVTGNIKSWNDLLPDYNAAGAASIASSKTAADTSGAQNTLQTAQNRFSTGLDTAQGDYATLDAANAAKQRDIVAKRYADEAAYNDLQNQSNNVAQAGVMRMTSKNGALRGGIPFGTDSQAAFARQSYEASLPYQLAKENYHQQNLANESGVETALTADEARRIGFNVSAQGQQYQSAQGTAQAIQALKVASASQDQETVKRILQNPQLLQEAMRQSMQGDAQLGLLITQAIGANNYQALQDKLGMQVSQPAYFTNPTGGYPAATSPVNNGGGGVAPNYFNPNGQAGGGTSTANGGVTLDATGGISPGSYNPYNNPVRNPYNLATQNPYPGNTTSGLGPDSQANSYYDPNNAVYRDRTTGQITGYAPGYNNQNVPVDWSQFT